MVYPYSNQVNYGNNLPVTYDTYKNKQSSAFPTALGVVAGGTLGGYLGYKGNPFNIKNLPKDSFTQKAYSKYVNKVGGNEKTLYTQAKTVLKELKKAKTVDEFKSLLNANPNITQEALGSNYDAILNNITENNLAQNKNTIKKALETQQNNSYQKMKNWIQNCWNITNKKLEKPTGMDENLFKAIKKTAQNYKLQNMGKGIAIGAVVTGLVSYIASKLYQASKVS